MKASARGTGTHRTERIVQRWVKVLLHTERAIEALSDWLHLLASVAVGVTAVGSATYVHRRRSIALGLGGGLGMGGSYYVGVHEVPQDVAVRVIRMGEDVEMRGAHDRSQLCMQGSVFVVTQQSKLWKGGIAG